MNSFFTQLITIGLWYESDIPCFMFLGEYEFPEE